MTDIPVDDHRLAVDNVDGKSLTHFRGVHVSEDNIKYQCFSSQSGLAAERNPFVALALLDDHIREYPEYAVSGFGKPVSFVSSSIGHDA